MPENMKGITPPHLAATVWKPGVSPNPGGRPKGLAAYIRENTMDGRELADYLLAVIRGAVNYKGGDRIKACEILLNRGFGAQPVIEGDAALKPILDTSKLTQEELDFIENVRLGFAALVERVKSRETTP
jgi:hypothetical protein